MNDNGIKTIAADDLEVGEFLTVVRGEKVDIQTMFGPGQGEYLGHLEEELLQIDALDLPLAVVTHWRRGGRCCTLSIDTRKCELRRLDPAFARAMMPKRTWRQRLAAWIGGER